MNIYRRQDREVAVLVNEQKTPGNYEVQFDGSHLSTGIYIYRLEIGGIERESRKMVLAR
jgi:hypothetical protein